MDLVFGLENLVSEFEPVLEKLSVVLGFVLPYPIESPGGVLLFHCELLESVLLDRFQMYLALYLQNFCVQIDPNLSPFLSFDPLNDLRLFGRQYLNDFLHLFP